jgi:hypothetical protein
MEQGLNALRCKKRAYMAGRVPAVFDDFGKEKAFKAGLPFVQPMDNVPGRERVITPKTFLAHFAGLSKTGLFHCPCLLIEDRAMQQSPAHTA